MSIDARSGEKKAQLLRERVSDEEWSLLLRTGWSPILCLST